MRALQFGLSGAFALLFLILGPGLWAADIPITIVGATQTQIVVSYAAEGACTITVTDNNGGTNPPRDLDASLFPHADSDLGRTAGNGFRWPTITNGPSRTVFLGGHDEIKKGADGRWYSTALQVASDHTISVACNGGADTGTIHVSTSNLPPGSYYPELPIPDATLTSPLGVPQPTVFYGGCSGGDPKCTSVNYIDAMTGVLMRRITSPIDRLGADYDSQAVSFGTAAVDRNGAWSNPNNFLTSQNPGTLATTSTTSAPIFAPFSAGLFGGAYDHITDIRAMLYGNASANGIRVGLCLSQDSGQTCASGEQVVTTTTSVGVQATVPSGYPSNYFSAWGRWNSTFAYGGYDISNRSIAGVSVSGSTVTIAPPTAPGFNANRKAGSVFTLTNCATGEPLILHIASVDTYAQITTTETGNTATNCTYTELASGIRARLIDAGTAHLSVTSQYMWGGGNGSGSNGDMYYCAKSKVTDITTDCDGVTHTPPISGTMCSFGNGIYLLQDNGRSCLQSNYFWPGGHLKSYGVTFASWADNKTFYATSWGSPEHLWKVQANKGGNYTEYVPNHSVPPDNFTYTDMGTGNAVNSQVATAGGFVAQQLATGLWPALGFRQTIDGYNEWTSCQGDGDPYCVYAYTDSSGTLVDTYAQWNNYPTRWSNTHESTLGFGGYSIHSSGIINIGAHTNRSITLGGPWMMRVTSMMKNGAPIQKTLTVTAATSASPAVFTITNGDLDQISTVASQEGAQVSCTGGTGSWAGANATLYLHKIDNNTWSAYTDATVPTALDSRTWGAYPGGITCTTAPALYTIPISSVPGDGTTNCSGAACARATLNLSNAGFRTFFPSGNSPIQDADPVVLTAENAYNSARPDSMDQTKQYYAKVTGVPAGSVDIYRDAALTQKVPNSEVSAAQGISYAEACPDPSAVSLPGPLYADSGWGTTGALKVRCVTLTVNSEPCSDYAATGEQAKYPCPSDPANSSRSSLMNLNVGDGVAALTDILQWGNHEILLVLRKNKISETQIQLTLMRWAVNSFLGRGWSACRTCDWYANTHSYGWVMTPYPLAFAGAVHFPAGDTSTIPFTPWVDSRYHCDYSQGTSGDHVMRVNSYYHGAQDDIINAPWSSLSSLVGGTTHDSYPVWAGDTADTVKAYKETQSYPNFRQVYGQFSGGEPLTKADWMALQSWVGGSGQNTGDNSEWSRTMTKVPGTSYTYKISTNSGVNLKVIPYLVAAWPQYYFADKSGPGSTLSDSDDGKKCHAFLANECVSGSSPGDTYIVMRGAMDTGHCTTNNQTVGSPCVTGLNAGTGWAVQILMQPIDRNASKVRRLTMAWTLPGAHYTYHHWDATPDNKWGLFASNPVNFRENYGRYQGAQYWAMKLPPWPAAEDSVNRTTFVSVARGFAGRPGDKIRIAFGYGENGDPTHLYCTTRAESCWTSAAATASNPYLFASEPQSKTTCDPGCTVQIPAIAGRVLYYQVERSNGAEVDKGPLEIVAVP